MFCLHCGKEVENGAVFCTNCGKRLEELPPVTVAEQEAAQTAESVNPVETAPQAEMIPTKSEEENTTYSFVYKRPEPAIPVVPEPVKKEKTYFGTGALVFCLVVIGLLAISTGIFAGLYFSVV